jgi:hypothetical protein
MAGENDDLLKSLGVLDTLADDGANQNENEGLDNEELGNDPEGDDQHDDTGAVDDAGDQHQDENQDDGDADNDDDQQLQLNDQQRQDIRDPADGQFRGKTDDLYDLNLRLKKDKRGNLLHNGKIVAAAGREARHFMAFRSLAQADRRAADKMAQHITKIAQGAEVLLQQKNALEKQKNILDTAGLDASEQAELVQIATAYKKNPVDGIKLMLTKAHLSGVDLKTITGTTGGLDPKVLMDQMREMLDERLKPVQQMTSERENQNKVQEETRGFFQRNEHARTVASFLGGAKQLGHILYQAKQAAPDVHVDELFQQLHYQLLVKFGGKIPTGPVGRRGNNKNPARPQRSQDRIPNRNTRSSDSFADIGKQVLADIQAATSRGQ